MEGDMNWRRSGMTLLELVVVLTIAGSVLAVGYSTFARAIDGRAQAARAARHAAEIVGVRRALTTWLDGARPHAPQPGTTDPAAARELRVITRSRTPLRGLQTVVRLFVDDERRGLVAVFRPSAGVDSLRILLDPSARAMSVEYLVMSNARHTWIPSDELLGASPLAMRLRIDSDDPVAATAFALPIEVPLARAP
jgi:prepilin-type N-terminal cleavage/methylation domain-containing protein